MAKSRELGRQTLTTPAELYLCLHVHEFPVQALLRLRPELRDQSCAVLDGVAPAQTVCSANSSATAFGITHGMTRVELDTFPHVVSLVRSAPEEASTRQALLECAGIFSPRVEQRNGGSYFSCVLDIAGSEKLFGQPLQLARCLLTRVKSLCVTASIAISCNFHAALCVAASQSARSQKVVWLTPGEERAALASLPVSTLEPSGQHAETLSLWGIHTLAQLAALPEKELIARMGQQGRQLRQLARGELPHLFQPVQPELQLQENMQLDTPVELLESLLFVLRVLLEQLIARAAARMLALATVTVVLTLEKKATHERTVRPAMPVNDMALWLKLLQLDLQSHPPPAAVISILLKAEPGSTSKVQLGLFSPQLPESARLDVTLARIHAIVGDNNVGSAVLKDTHRADASLMAPFQAPKIQRQQAFSSPTRAAMRQLRPAEMISMRIREDRPQAFVFRDQRYTVERAFGPWLASGDWWNPTLWSVEGWDLMASLESGAQLSCCVVQDRRQNCWLLRALYD